MVNEHPSAGVLQAAAETCHLDTTPGFKHREQLLEDPAHMPALETMIGWAHRMRRLVGADRTR